MDVIDLFWGWTRPIGWRKLLDWPYYREPRRWVSWCRTVLYPWLCHRNLINADKPRLFKVAAGGVSLFSLPAWELAASFILRKSNNVEMKLKREDNVLSVPGMCNFHSSANGFNFLLHRYSDCLLQLTDSHSKYGVAQRRRKWNKQCSLQTFYSCNSLTKSSVSSEWNNFNVHFALDIFLTLTQA